MNHVEVSGMRPALGAIACALLLCACRQPPRPSQQQEQSTQAAPETASGSSEDLPSFSAEIAQLDDGGLSEFLDENVGETVYLDLTIPQKEFQGGQERDLAFFTVFDECPEDLNENEKPNQSKCEGAEYLLPKQALKRNRNGDYKVTGNFHPSEKSGPNQGLFSVKLTPVATSASYH